MRLASFIALGFLIVSSYAATVVPGFAAQGWELLGTRSVNFGADLDRIVVGRDDGRFGEIMFEVDGGAIALYNVRVIFGNGQDFSPATELVFSDDERSRAINLPGGDRIVRSIVFNYRSLRTGQGTAAITVYGR
jgi:hypothetical protein